MESELKYIEGQPFYYQIGEVKTIIPWWRPTYDRVCKFLIQEEVAEVFSKYSGVQIIGNCLWDFDVTWDLDLRLILNKGEIRDWSSIENDINKLNHLALNEWRILPDIGVADETHRLPTRQEILDELAKGNNNIIPHEDWLMKIAYVKKVVNDEMFENDIRASLDYECVQLTERYLVSYKPTFYSKKIIDKITNSKKEILENAISIDEFLSMGEEEFIKFQNY
jgi:hypothetical protein